MITVDEFYERMMEVGPEMAKVWAEVMATPIEIRVCNVLFNPGQIEATITASVMSDDEMAERIARASQERPEAARSE